MPRGEFDSYSLPNRQTFYKDTAGIGKYERELVDYERQRAVEVEGFKGTLRPEEVQILEGTLVHAKQAGTISLPPQLQDKGWFDMLKVGDLSHDLYQRYRYLRQIPELVPQYRPTKERQFHIPADYRDASFEDFELLCEGHKRAWLLLTHFGPNPPKGLYLWGNYGTGKTHLIAAFARGLQAELAAGSFRRIADFAGGAIEEYEDTWLNKLQLPQDGLKGLNYGDSTHKRIQQLGAFQNPSEEGQQLEGIAPKHLRRAWKDYPYQPTDVAFATFDYLFERADDEAFVNDFLSRRIVIIDDIHPKDDRARLDFIQRIVEQRYNEYRTGATFITSNLPPDRVLAGTNYPREIGERGHSRLREMCMPIEFDVDDFRLRKAAQADEELLRFVQELEQENP